MADFIKVAVDAMGGDKAPGRNRKWALSMQFMQTDHVKVVSDRTGRACPQGT